MKNNLNIHIILTMIYMYLQEKKVQIQFIRMDLRIINIQAMISKKIFANCSSNIKKILS